MNSTWRDEANCLGTDPGAFFHPDNERHDARVQRVARAKRVCSRCPVRAECLTEALAMGNEYGVWGGLSESEREALKKRQRQAA